MHNEKVPFNTKLLPNNYKKIEKLYGERGKYNYLDEVSIAHANYKNIGCDWKESGKHHAWFQSLDQQQIEDIGKVALKNTEFDFNGEILSIFENILTDEVDEALKSYLGTNYAISFYSLRELTADSENTNPSCKWHCDGAPVNSAMVMCYLDGDEDHGSSTLFMKEGTTDALKEYGYIYCKLINRLQDLDPLLDYYQLDNTTVRHAAKPGETVVFGAAKVAHRAEAPRGGSTRSTFDLCIIPSPIPWKEAIAKGFTPYNYDISYEGRVDSLLACADLDSPGEKVEVNNSNVIQIPASGGIISKDSLKYHLETIFSDRTYTGKLFEQLMGMTVNFNTLTIAELLFLLKKSFKDGLDWSKSFNKADMTNVTELISYEKKFYDAMHTFSLNGKPKPEAVMWPIPDHADHPRCKFDMLPYVVSEKIMNKSTPIGSAGSCFAVEIAEVLQKEKFNYVITELGDNPAQEAIIDGYKVDSGEAMYSANFGILFNTPSLRQIAEKAFGEKEFNQYLLQIENGLHMDPYRENVYFASKENYLRDYPKHVEAIRQTLLQSEVFIFTAGLNECWQLNDGTVISRNPRGGFYHLIEHRVLTVEENVNNIITFFNIVKRHNPKFKLILTLSPVPLLATGRGETHHILEANTHSKAVLRVAIEEVVKTHKDIHYLPSYELVTECMPNAWKADHRHVTRETVSKVISMFKEMFVEGEQ